MYSRTKCCTIQCPAHGATAASQPAALPAASGSLLPPQPAAAAAAEAAATAAVDVLVVDVAVQPVVARLRHYEQHACQHGQHVGQSACDLLLE
jgi:hypothetical protein